MQYPMPKVLHYYILTQLSVEAFSSFRAIRRDKEVSLDVNVKFPSICVLAILLYASEDDRKLAAYETRRYRKLFQIRWQEKTTNETIRCHLDQS